ncbi:MAG: AAA family ATPase [Candidatus Heimdallarchaeaceae archaeon]
MKRIKFLEVGMENYGPYLDPMVLTFNQDMITMIVGPNGIGKSMALDAICFTLYGMTSKGLRADDVVNNVVKKNCKTWVKFNVNDIEYIISRYQKYIKVGSTVILSRGGVDIKKGHKEVLPEIERLICNRRSFLNTLMFGQKVKDFFTDLKDSDKKEIFRSLLDLDKYKVYYDKCSKVIKMLTEELSEIKQQIGISSGILENAKLSIIQFEIDEKQFVETQQKDLLTIQSNIEECNRILTKCNTDFQKIEEPAIEKTEQEIQTISNTLIALEGNLHNQITQIAMQKSKKLNELQVKVSEAMIKISDDLNGTKISCNERIISLKDILKDYTEENTRLRMDIEMHSNALLQKITELEMRVSEIQESVLGSEESKCPLCEQAITVEKANKLKLLVKNYEQEIIQIQNRSSDDEKERRKVLKELQTKSDEINEEISNITMEIKTEEFDSQTKEVKVSKRHEIALSKVDVLVQEQTESIREKTSEEHRELRVKQDNLYRRKDLEKEQLEKYQEAQNNIISLERDLSQYKNALKIKEEEEYDKTQLNLYKKKVHELYISIENSQESIGDKLLDLEVYEFWKQGFSSSGIPSMLIDESIPFMNQRVDYYLNLLANGRYTVSFDTLDQTKAGEFRDKISVNVFDSQTKANNRLQLSGGQTRIVDIATILTLGDLQTSIQNVSFNLLIFDEIFDSLDDENINYVSRIMTKLKVGKSIFIISHRHVDQLETDEVLEFK